MKFIPELTGLRGLAALMVFAGHASKDGLLPGFLDISYAIQGVLLFFILSGFLMGQIYLEKKLHRESLVSYMRARAARVFPLYFTILLLSFIISYFFYADFHYDFRNPIKLLIALFFINTPYELWTIPIEVQFYLCFILFWFFYSKEKKNTLLLVSIPFLLFLPSLLFFIFKHKVPHVMPTFSLFFFSGILLSVLKNKGYLEKIKNNIPSFVSWSILILFVLNLAGMREILGVTNPHPTHNIYSIILLLSFSLIVISKPKDFVLLRSRAMIFIGEISFGFYLIHRPIMKIAVDQSWNPTIILLITLSTTITIAYILYRAIEVPVRKMISESKIVKA